MDDLIFRTKKSVRSKLLILDFDGTLVKPKEGRQFPKDVEDWQFTRDSVPETVKGLAKGRQIVLVTDQTKPWKVDQIKTVMREIGVEYTAVIGGKTHKPSTALFDSVFPTFNRSDSLYIGDAGGREGDWSDVDKKFATAVGVKFYSPEEVFPLEEIVAPKSVKQVNPEEKEVVILVGYPASGKSTIAKTVLKDYYRVDGDILKTAAKMVKDAEKHLDQSIVFDSTAGTKERRAEYVAFAKKHDLPVRVFWMQTPIDVAIERNKQRGLEGGVKIPSIVFAVYRKRFEEPVPEEGFAVVKI